MDPLPRVREPTGRGVGPGPLPCQLVVEERRSKQITQCQCARSSAYGGPVDNQLGKRCPQGQDDRSGEDFGNSE